MSATEAAPVPYPTAVALFPTLRQSLLSSFDDCHLKAGMSVEYERGWSSHEQARGQLLHRAIAKCLILMYDPEKGERESKIDADTATGILYEVMRQHDVTDDDFVACNAKQRKDMRWEIRKWANDSEFPIDDLVDVEQRLQAVVRYENPDGGFVERIVTGALDAVFISGEQAQHASVLDWKSTWALPGPQEVSEGGYFQQRFYAFLIFVNYPSVQSVTLDERYIRRSESREATVFRSEMGEIATELSMLAEQFDRAVEHGKMPWDKDARSIRRKMREARKAEDIGRFRTLRTRYEQTVGLWKATPGHHCNFCPRPQACPILPAARGAGRITDQTTAERVAEETRVADEAARKGKIALKEWADRPESGGIVPVRSAKGAKAWGHVAGQRTRSPKPEDVQAEIELAAAQGRAPNVEGLWKTYTGTSFRYHEPKPLADTAEDGDLIEKLERSVEEAQAARTAREEAKAS